MSHNHLVRKFSMCVCVGGGGMKSSRLLLSWDFGFSNMPKQLTSIISLGHRLAVQGGDKCLLLYYPHPQTVLLPKERLFVFGCSGFT